MTAFPEALVAMLEDLSLPRRLSRDVVHGHINLQDHRAPSWAGVNAALEGARLQPPRIRVFNDGIRVDEAAYMVSRYDRRGQGYRMIDLPALYSTLREGSGLVIDNLDEADPLVRDIALALSRLVGERVQANAYITWGTTSGFGVHRDDHDVIILQLSGSKQWKVYGPNRGDKPTAEDIDPVWEGTLESGDILHVPRDWWHDVSGNGTGSYHLTFGFTRRTVADLVSFLVSETYDENFLASDLEFSDPAVIAEQVRTISKHLPVSDQHVQTFQSRHQSSLPGVRRAVLPFSVDLTGSWSNTIVRSNMRSALKIDSGPDGGIEIEAMSTKFIFSRHYRPILECLSTGKPITFDQLREVSKMTDSAVKRAVSNLASQGIVSVDIVN